jgi:putative FmdB family regulatory protein
MPFYEYQCGSCGHHVEVLQKVSDSPLRKCPDCGKSTMKRLMSAPVFRLKGSGWYETDFKSDRENKRNLAGRDDEGGSESKSESDSKPSESKSDSAPGEKKTIVSKPAIKSAKPAAKPAKKKATKPAAKKKARR